MLSENTTTSKKVRRTVFTPTNHDETYHNSLSNFVTQHYKPLLNKACYLVGNRERGKDLLHDTVQFLLEGKANLDLSRKGTLSYIQSVMRSLYHHQRIDRQRSFERGYQVTIDKTTTKQAFITTPIHVNLDLATLHNHAEPHMIEADQWEQVKSVFRHLTAKEQILIGCLLQGGGCVEFNEQVRLICREEAYTLSRYRELYRRTVKKMQDLLQDVSRDDRGR